MGDQTMFSHAATIFTVKDPDSSTKFYVDLLGFEVTFRWKSPSEYVVLKNGTVSLHLSKGDIKAGNGIMYVFVYDIDKVYNEFVRRGLTSISRPEKQEYQMEDFDVTDPDGNRITFGCGQ